MSLALRSPCPYVASISPAKLNSLVKELQTISVCKAKHHQETGSGQVISKQKKKGRMYNTKKTKQFNIQLSMYVKSLNTVSCEGEIKEQVCVMMDFWDF